MKSVSDVLSLSAVTAMLACVHAPGHPIPEVQKAVDAGNARFAEALKRSDAAAIASLFTDDATLVHPAATGILRGRAAIEEFNRGRLAKSKILDVVLTTVSLEVVGDLALEAGTNSLLVQTGEAEPVRRTGRARPAEVTRSAGAARGSAVFLSVLNLLLRRQGPRADHVAQAPSL